MSTATYRLTPSADQLFPPMPEPVPIPFPVPEVPFPVEPVLPKIPPIRRLRALRCGCYLLRYTPVTSSLVTYDGTLRVECEASGVGRTASGDLYQRPILFLPPTHRRPPLPPFLPRPMPFTLPGPHPANGIPTLPRSQYRYYLRVTQILEFITTTNNFTLGFEMWRFSSGNWSNEGDFTAQMTWTTAPAGFPSSTDYLVGDVKDHAGQVVGALTMGWVSTYLRKATIEIDHVTPSEAPVTDGFSRTWRTVFGEVGWDVTVHQSDNNLIEPSGASWSDAELHAEMLQRRDSSDLDSEWRYHILAVQRLDSTERGIMYDAFATDSNNVPREGVGISSHWMIPNAPLWGLVAGKRVGTALEPYFRTAIHEIGHAMGLFHNTVDVGFMNTTDVIASAGTPTTPFPNNIKWSFAPDDQKRLRHYPDMYVRPGGTPFGTASTINPPISPNDMESEMDGLTLKVSALLDMFPLGAPVRVDLEMLNTGNQPIYAPTSLNMKHGFVKGRTIDTSGTERSFIPLVNCFEDEPMDYLNPGDSIRNSITLLRGGQGALFPVSGMYTIVVEVHWDVQGIECYVSGSTQMMVTPAEDNAHAAAAFKVLSTPDTLLTLVLGGDHLKDGIEAIQTALENPVLRPHYAYIEAKRVAEHFGKRAGQYDRASDLIQEAPVMSSAEIKKATKIVPDSSKNADAKAKIAQVLKARVRNNHVDPEVKKLVLDME